MSGILYGYTDDSTEAGVVTFGLETDDVPAMKPVLPSRFARDPWVSGNFQPGPSPTAAFAIVDWIARAPASTLAR